MSTKSPACVFFPPITSEHPAKANWQFTRSSLNFINLCCDLTQSLDQLRRKDHLRAELRVQGKKCLCLFSSFGIVGNVERDERQTVGDWKDRVWKHNLSLIYGVWQSQTEMDGHGDNLIYHYGFQSSFFLFELHLAADPFVMVSASLGFDVFIWSQ